MSEQRQSASLSNKASGSPLRLAIVGHTNTGKTSLMRTLTRDARFGEVADLPGTTRHVECARLFVQGRAVLELYDTPGIEEPIELLALIDEQSTSGSREPGPQRIDRFLASEPAAYQFEQEAKVLRQMRQCDAALFVIDARDTVLAKHRDELAVLNLCGIPLMPLLNFVADDISHEADWREAMAGLGLHAIIRFDTVVPPSDGERLLYGKMATLLDSHAHELNALVASHEEDARQRRSAAMTQIAAMLVRCAALRRIVDVQSESDLEKAARTLNTLVRDWEQRCVSQLLSLYRFYPDEIASSQIPLVNGRWQSDIFDPDTLQDMGIRIGGGAAAGAAAGLGVDALFGGLTLGAAAATGALLGGGWQTFRHFGEQLKGQLTGAKQLRIDDNILQGLAARECALARALERRGHAARTQASTDGRLEDELSGAMQTSLSPLLKAARRHPEWAYQKEGWESSGFTSTVEQVAQYLAQQMPGLNESR